MKILFCCANVFLSDFMLKSSSNGSSRISKGSQNLIEQKKIESKGKCTRVGREFLSEPQHLFCLFLFLRIIY